MSFVPPWTQINASSPGALDNKYGFEDARVVRTQGGTGTFWMLVAEMHTDPLWVAMRLGLWRSPDGWSWSRAGTLARSSGLQNGSDPCAAVWGANLAWDGASWSALWVCYNAAPNDARGWLVNYNGTIWASRSPVAGDSDAAMLALLAPGGGGDAPASPPVEILWPSVPVFGPFNPAEGLQGTDSFCPYPLPASAGGGWAGMVGSSHSEANPAYGPGKWVVSLATAPALDGPWTRQPAGGLPVPVLVDLDGGYSENPMTYPAPRGWLPGANASTGAGLMAVFDYLGSEERGFGLTCSGDGLHWAPGALVATPDGGTRTPAGLLPMTPTDVRANVDHLRAAGASEAQLAAWAAGDAPSHASAASQAGVTASAPYWVFYTAYPSDTTAHYEVFRTALGVLSW